MIVIPLPQMQGVQLPAEPAPAPEPAKGTSEPTDDGDVDMPTTRSRSNSLTADERSRSGTPSRSSSRRSTPRANSAAFARARQQPTPSVSSSPAPRLDPVTGVELDTSGEDPRALKYEVPVDVPIPSFGKQTKDLERDLGRLYEAVAGARRIAVICGAGVSVSSPANIPDFRSANGLFKKLKEQHPSAGLSSGKDLFDARLFSSESTSALFYTMIAELKSLADDAKPTIFHRFLKRLDEEGRLQRVYTQNIDGLEQKAGLTFGLGETGDSTSTVRALGKRKREGRGWARSKSDSALLAKRPENDGEPMFPRTIPLHGTLQTLTCALCSHKVTLGDTTQLNKVFPPRSDEEPVTEFTPRETLEALDLLKEGEAVPCPKCARIDEVRQIGGLRSRGVGRMKTDVVLYGGQNEGAERVGECLQRDILGLRDPNETPVPESIGEIRHRERREKKEAERLQKQEEQARQTLAKAAAASTSQGGAAVKAEDVSDAALVETQLGGDRNQASVCDTSMAREDILARAFMDEADVPDQKPGGLQTIAEDAPATFVEAPQPAPAPAPARPKRTQQRLKPLPPDLLIVAGTSLKVPGTKRIVREFAKACHARDARYYYSDSDDEGEEESEEDSTKGKARRSSRSRSGSADKEETKVKKEGNGKDDEEGEEEEEEDDPNAPIRTILLNYDFPVPASQWDDVFDVWVQGDLQRAALGVFPPRDVGEDAEDARRAIETVRSQYSWEAHKRMLEEQRLQSKRKPGRRAGSSAMSRTASKEDETPPRTFPGRRTGAWGRSKSESVIKRQKSSGDAIDELRSKPAAAATAAATKGRGGSMKRTTSKKNAAAALELSASDATAGENGSVAVGKGKAAGAGAGSGSGKGRGGVGQKGAPIESSVAPPTPPPSTPSAESTPEPEPEHHSGDAHDGNTSQRKRAGSMRCTNLRGVLGPYVQANLAPSSSAVEGSKQEEAVALVGNLPRRTMARSRSRNAI